MASLIKNVVNSKQELEKGKLQRRSTFVDLFGVPFLLTGGYSETAGEYVATQWISVSPDFSQWLRFQFKIFVVSGNQKDFNFYIDDHNITQDLKDLQGGDWINDPVNKYGVYPDIAIEESTDDEDGTSPYYDLLEVASLEVAKGNRSLGDAVIFPRFKKFQVTSKEPFTLQLYLYSKYSCVGR